jgi:hypothetical protein
LVEQRRAISSVLLTVIFERWYALYLKEVSVSILECVFVGVDLVDGGVDAKLYNGSAGFSHVGVYDVTMTVPDGVGAAL